jgi:hypothetical protein
MVKVCPLTPAVKEPSSVEEISALTTEEILKPDGKTTFILPVEGIFVVAVKAITTSEDAPATREAGTTVALVSEPAEIRVVPETELLLSMTTSELDVVVML